MSTGERLRKLRKQEELTLDQLAKMTGVAKATLSRIENGVVGGNMDTIKKIASALHVSFDELVSEDSGDIEPVENDALVIASLKRDLKVITEKLQSLCVRLNVQLDSKEYKKTENEEN